MCAGSRSVDRRTKQKKRKAAEERLKVGRKKDRVWNYVKELPPNRWECKFCKRKFSGGASRIRPHLSRKKGYGIKVCQEVSEEVSEEVAIDALNRASHKKAEIKAASNNCLEDESRTPNCQGTNNSEIDKLFPKFPSQASNHVAIGSASSRDFLEGSKTHDSTYEAKEDIFPRTQNKVSCSTLFPLMENMGNEAKKYHDDTLEAYGIGWSLLYSIHGSRKDLFGWTPNELVHIKPCSSSGNEVEIISTAIENIGERNVAQLISNAPSDITDVLCEKFPRIWHIPCVASAICRLLKEVCNVDLMQSVGQATSTPDDESVADITSIPDDGSYGDYKGLKSFPLDDDNDSVSTSRPGDGSFRDFKFWESYLLGDNDSVSSIGQAASLLNGLINNFQAHGGEIQYKTRNSDICQVYEFISLLNKEKEWHDLSRELPKQLNSDEYFFDCYFEKSFLNQVKIVASIILPLFQALFLAYGDGSSSGRLFEAIKKVEDAVRKCENDHIRCEVQHLFEKHEKRLFYPVHAAAAFLNPDYMFRRNFEEDTIMEEGIQFVHDKLLKGKEKEVFRAQVNQYRQMLQNMFQNGAMTISNVIDPHGIGTWWEIYGRNLHVLKKYAVQILSQPCGSLFGLRCQLRQENDEFGIEKMLEERFKCQQIHMEDSIILDDLDLLIDKASFGNLEDHNPIVEDLDPLIEYLGGLSMRTHLE